MIQLLVICYNSRSCILDTLNSWSPFVGRICVLINGGIENDYSQLEDTKLEISKVNHNNLVIFRDDFKNFSQMRNKLISLSRNKKYQWNIFIDDSYKLISWNWKPSNNVQMMRIIRRGVGEYDSNRIFKRAFYKGLVHETIDSESRFQSGIVVEDVVYEDHVERTSKRQLHDLELLSEDKSPRGLYYRACTSINLYKEKKISKGEVLIVIRERIEVDGDPQENVLIRMYLNCILNS